MPISLLTMGNWRPGRALLVEMSPAQVSSYCQRSSVTQMTVETPIPELGFPSGLSTHKLFPLLEGCRRQPGHRAAFPGREGNSYF